MDLEEAKFVKARNKIKNTEEHFRLLAHPFIVRLKWACVSKQGKLSMFTEYYGLGDLRQWLANQF